MTPDKREKALRRRESRARRRLIAVVTEEDPGRKQKMLTGSLLRILRPREADILGVDTVEGAEAAAKTLFRILEAWHGEDAAHRILTKAGAPESKNELLLLIHDFMPELTVRQLAMKLAAINGTLPKAKRYGPRGTDNWKTMDAQLRRLLDAREDRRRRKR
jgi:hypothetical protein